MKLFDRKDTFGTGDSIMAVTVDMIFVSYPKEKFGEWTWPVFYGVVLLLMLFKF